MKIAIVNDMVMAIEGLKRAVLSSQQHEIAWTAADGLEAVARCQRSTPDLILMDLIMPNMDGVNATREIMRLCPCPILIVTASVNQNSALVFEALGQGALDAINTPLLAEASQGEGSKALLRKIAAIGILTNGKWDDKLSGKATRQYNSAMSNKGHLITIGASSGGPQAIAHLLRQLPKHFAPSVVIVQHIDRQFVGGLADWLSQQCQIPVTIAEEGSRPEPGKVFLADSDKHLVMRENMTFHYQDEPQTPYQPSVDVFWQSVGKYWQHNLTAILLTGMGRDGAQAMLELRERGVHTIAQSKESCAVFGMPKAAIALNAAVDVRSIEEIAGILGSLCQ